MDVNRTVAGDDIMSFTSLSDVSKLSKDAISKTHLQYFVLIEVYLDASCGSNDPMFRMYSTIDIKLRTKNVAHTSRCQPNVSHLTMLASLLA